MTPTTATTTTPPITAPRLDTITPIHKALRRVLFETAIQLARTDFGDAAETTTAETAIARCFAFLRDHLEHEDRHVQPLLARFAPDLSRTIATDHPDLERSAIAIESLFPRLAPLTGVERARLGGELARRFQTFVADQVKHMDFEEREVIPALWAHLTDAEMAAISGRIVAEMGPAKMAVFGEILFPSLSRPEREAMQRKPA